MRKPISQITIGQLIAMLAVIVVIIAIVVSMRSDRRQAASTARQLCLVGITSACSTP